MKNTIWIGLFSLILVFLSVKCLSASELWYCKSVKTAWSRYTNRPVNSKDVRCREVRKRFSYTKLPKGAFKGFLPDLEQLPVFEPDSRAQLKAPKNKDGAD